MSPKRAAPVGDRAGSACLPENFLFGVATAGFQVEGGYNGPDQPANNWLAWEQVGRVEPSGEAVGFWERPEEALDRAAGLGCTSFRLSVEWARVYPDAAGPDRAVLARYRRLVEACTDRGLEPLVTLHHFTHPSWLGEDFWLRPDAASRYRQWAEVVADTLAGSVRHWITVNEINVLAINSWLVGTFPPGRTLAFEDAAIATDQLVAAHVAGYEVLHRARPDAVVTTNSASMSVYELDRMLTDLLLVREAGVARHDVDDWIAERRRAHDRAIPPRGVAEGAVRRIAAAGSPYGRVGHRPQRGRGVLGNRPPLPRHGLDAVYRSTHRRTLDVLGLDFYDPEVARQLRVPGHRTAGGRSAAPTRELWEEAPDPAGLTRWLVAHHQLAPSLPLWVVENGMCNRVRLGRSEPRPDGWDRRRYLRENLAAVVAAVDAGAPVAGYWHWSLMDNYEWGSYEPRYGLYRVDGHRSEPVRWMETDAMGVDSAGTYRAIIAGLRAGDRSVLAPS